MRCKIYIIFNIFIFTISLGLIISAYKFIKTRYLYFKFIKDKESKKYILPLVIYKAAFEKYKFVKIRKWKAQIGHTNGNVWLKPYKCNPSYFSTFFQDESEKRYVYKFDYCLLLMIKIVRYFGKIPKDIDFSQLNEIMNAKDELNKIDFYKKV